MPGLHAVLAPSAAERWIQCPASIRMEQEIIPVPGHGDDNVYAREGTQAHVLGEIKASHRFGYISDAAFEGLRLAWVEDTEEEWQADIERYTDLYVDLLVDLAAEHEHSVVRLEQRVDTGIPSCWGTADAAVISPGHLRVVDLKYGQGVVVNAESNPQLMLYSVGALEEYDLLGSVDKVTMTVFQPRAGGASHWTVSATELREWRDSVIPVAERALSGEGEFGPSESACRWCPARGECRARVEYMTRLDFGDPEVLSLSELADMLERLPGIRQWCNDLEETALVKAYSQQQPIPGWKVVLSGGNRHITDKEAAIEVLVDAGYPPSEISRTDTQTLGELERVVGKEELPQILGDLLVKGEGKPSLVPEDDSRPAIDPYTEAKKEDWG